MIRSETYFNIIKSFFDLFLAILLIIFLLPLFLTISIIIFLEDGLPIVFKQKRIGLGGKLFTIYKFRSMKNNCELEGNKYYCYEGDKRITKVGFFLRKFSLDELPQLFNIIKHEMSFVGPRPAIHDEFKYENIEDNLYKIIELRNKVLPGITGYAQVKSRNDLDWNQKLRLDFIYLNMSPKERCIADISIILSTFFEILYSKGEYDKRLNKQ